MVSDGMVMEEVLLLVIVIVGIGPVSIAWLELIQVVVLITKDFNVAFSCRHRQFYYGDIPFRHSSASDKGVSGGYPYWSKFQGLT